MNIKSVFSTEKNLDNNIADIQNQLQHFHSKLVIYFASSQFNPEELSKKMNDSFQGATVYGCSTAGEITSGHMLEHSIVVMAFNEKSMGDVKVEVVENLKKDDGTGIEKAFQSFEHYYGENAKEMDYKKYVGMVLFEMTALAEEWVMDKIGDLTNVVFIGATAGDDLSFKQTYVYANGKAYKDCVLLALLKPNVEFDFLKTQSVCSLNTSLVATKVDEANRHVIEFDGKPAAERYAEVFDVSLDNLSDLFFTNPLGLVSGEEIFIRSPYGVIDNSKIAFYCNILEGMEVTCLQTQNIVEDTKRDLNKKLNEIGPISGLIDFQCILRTLELRNKKQTDSYGKLFSNIPTIGFSTYGEEFIGHINQTSTMLIFK